MMASNDNKINRPIKCSICRAEIIDRVQLHQVGSELIVVCFDCHERFTDEDLQIMADLFLLYKGYFGMLEGEAFTTVEFIEGLIDELDSSEDRVNIDQINMKMLHNALIHGITPEEYSEKLKLLIE